MSVYSFSHLGDAVLLRTLAELIARDRASTATLVACIAEVDARRLYLPAGYASMHAYCVDALHLSEDAAYKRIQAARAARQFPVLFAALADGRLHLAAVCLLAPHLTPENAGELLAAATHQRKSTIEQMLARRFGSPEAPAMIRAIVPSPSTQLAPGQVGTDIPDILHADVAAQELSSAPQPTVAQHAPERFQLTIGKSTHDKLRYAQALLSHAIPSGDVGQVLDRALDTLIGQLEKRKLGATDKPRSRRKSAGKRHVPAEVRRAVWERDQGRCTFVGDTGHRCGARGLVEFDHVEPAARGGQATVRRVRLLCRGHNQLEADRTFGAGFMNEKREASRRAAESRVANQARNAEEARPAEARSMAEAEAAAEASERATAREHAKDVLSALRGLGVRPEQARRLAEYSETLRHATLEQRLLAALRCLGPNPRVESRVGPNARAST